MFFNALICKKAFYFEIFREIEVFIRPINLCLNGYVKQEVFNKQAAGRLFVKSRGISDGKICDCGGKDDTFERAPNGVRAPQAATIAWMTLFPFPKDRWRTILR
ncbi:MAG TPA: hypothetical protein VJ910_02775 [Desulfuromonadales bacterium]|nr:hypothetical protein [Desulfuromonadales bacterium]